MRSISRKGAYQERSHCDRTCYNITPFWKDVRPSWEDVILLYSHHEVEHEEDFGNGAEALILQKTMGEAETYTRIGTVSYALERWFLGHGVEEVITVM